MLWKLCYESECYDNDAMKPLCYESCAMKCIFADLLNRLRPTDVESINALNNDTEDQK